MLQGLHLEFPLPEVTGHPGRDSYAEKKLKKEYGRWMFEKEILGWLVQGLNYTIQLPDDKCEGIVKLIKKVLQKK
eukprot:12973095-Ditylum_brightwellii.AAC.1